MEGGEECRSFGFTRFVQDDALCVNDSKTKMKTLERPTLLTNRRSVLASISTLGVAVLAPLAKAEGALRKRIFSANPASTPPSVYSPAVAYGNLLFLAGKSSRSAAPGEIHADAKWVFDELEKELKNAGSSMDKVLKVNVALSDIKDYAALNEIFAARFPKEPPARTTVISGNPRGTTVEIDLTAYI